MSLEIVSLGFDLDNTLYDGAKTNEAIQDHICGQASTFLDRPYEEIREIFRDHYERTQSASGSLTLMGIGSSKGVEIVQTSLEEADVSPSLERDEKLVGMFDRLSQRYKLFLITSSSKNTASKKLSALGIESSLFSPFLYRDSPYLRNDGSAFEYVASNHNVSFDSMMFVGDREKVDIIPAKSLGIKTAIVNATSDEADYQLRNIYELEKFLNLSSQS